MAKHTLPGLGLTGGFVDSEDGWGDDMNANLLKMSAIGSGTVKARVAAVPGAPVAGDIYILTTDDTVAVYDTAWTYYAPVEGWLFYDRGADVFINYNGADWVVLETGGGGDFALPDPTGKAGKIVAANADGTGYELVDDQVGTGGGDSGGEPEDPGLLPHRYWRILTASNNGDGYTGLMELYFGAADGTDFPPVGGEPIASGTLGGAGIAAAFDRQGTNWQVNQSANVWIGYVYTSPVKVRQVKIQASGQFPAQTPAVFGVQWSDDGVTWTTKWTVSTGSTGYSAGQLRTFNDPVLDPIDATVPNPNSKQGKVLAVKRDNTGLEWINVRESFVIALGDEINAITTGGAKVTFRMPYAFTLESVRASLTTASSAGIPTIDIRENGSSILSTKLTIDQGEKTSVTAAVPAVISDVALGDDAEITFNIDVAGTGATGLKVVLIGHQ